MPFKLKEIRIFRGSQFQRILKEQKLALGFTLVIFFLVILFFKLFISPGVKKVIKLRRELVNINRDLKEFQKIFLKHPDIEREIKLLESRQQTLIHSFPPEKEFLSVTQKVLRELEKQNLKLINFKYLYELKDHLPEGFKKYGLELELITDYLKFGKFLEGIEKEGFKFVIDKVKISRTSQWPLDINVKIDFILREK